MAINAASAALAYVEALKRPTVGGGAGGGGAALGGAGGPSFADMVQDVVGQGVATAKAGEAATVKAATGDMELIDVITAVAKAETTLQTVVAVRDQVIQAYLVIVRMPI
jgi:flagellar hook-basal body complex protein FliE